MAEYTEGAKTATGLVSFAVLCCVVAGLIGLERSHGMRVTTWVTNQATRVWKWLKEDLFAVFVEFFGELVILVACWVTAEPSGSFKPSRELGLWSFAAPILLSVSTVIFLFRFIVVLTDKEHNFRPGGRFRRPLDYVVFCICLFFGVLSFVCSSLLFAFTCIDEQTLAPKYCRYLAGQGIPHHHDKRNWGNITAIALDFLSILWGFFSYLWNKRRARNN